MLFLSLLSFCTSAPSIYESKMASTEDTNADVPWTDKSTPKDKCLPFSFGFCTGSTLDGITDKCMAVFSENFGSEIPWVFRETKWKGEAFCGFDPHTCSWSETNAGVNRFYGLLPMSVAHWTTFWLTLLFLKTLMRDQINHGTVFRKEQTNWTREWERGLKSTLQASAPLRQCFLQLCNLSPLNAWIRLRSPPFPIP